MDIWGLNMLRSGLNTNLYTCFAFQGIRLHHNVERTEDLSKGVGNSVLRNFAAMCPGRTIIR